MADINYTLRYKPLSSLLFELEREMTKHSAMGLLDELVVIKQVMYCLYDLGIRVFSRYEDVFDIAEGRAKLPDHFHSIIFAMLCDRYEVVNIPPQGLDLRVVKITNDEVPDFNDHINGCLTTCPRSQVESLVVDCCGRPLNRDRLIDPQQDCNCDDGCNGCDKTRKVAKKVFVVNDTGGRYSLVQVVKGQAFRFSNMMPLYLERNFSDNTTSDYLECTECMRLNKPINTFKVRDGWMIFNVRSGKVYVMYLGLPFDTERNELLVPTHPYIDEYILYSIKERIIENAVINKDDASNVQLLTYFAQKKNQARYIARSFVSTPTFREIRMAWMRNRAWMYNNYIKPMLF